jgi:hypothetical protein
MVAAFSLMRNNLQYRSITSEPTDRYNCIAWAAGDDRKWWWPNGSRYWPNLRKGEERDPTQQEFVFTFRALGFRPTTSRAVEAGRIKVAFYERNGAIQHAARQLPNGVWTSKCGPNVDIEHDLEQLEGTCYGRVSVVMFKPVV